MLILTGLYVAATFIYAFLTYRILRANQSAVAAMTAQITASVRPYVYFDLFIENDAVKARLCNTGRTAAHNIDVSTTPQLRRHVQSVNSPSVLTHNRTAFLPPNREIVEVIGTLAEFLSQPAMLTLNGNVSYSDEKDHTWSEPFQINLSTHPAIAT